MYEAVNKGLAMASGGILAYLNCDEQYLVGALSHVATFFRLNPSIDMLFGGIVLIEPDGTLVASRPAYRPSWRYVAASHLYLLTCGMFFRRRLVDHGLCFDETLADVADAKFVVDALRGGYKARHTAQCLAAFTLTGRNRSGGMNARGESILLQQAMPRHVRTMRWVLIAMRRLEKLYSGGYSRRPITYAVYSEESTEQRASFSCARPPWRWPS